MRGLKSLKEGFAERLANARLVKKYPFLLTRNRLSGKAEWLWWKRYACTEVDLMEVPEAWKERLMMPLFERLSAVLREYGCEKDFRIEWIKEKYGALRFYYFYHGALPEKAYDAVEALIDEAKDRSMGICTLCGGKADCVTRGYVLFVCEGCAKDRDLDYRRLDEGDLPARSVKDPATGRWVDVPSPAEGELREAWGLKPDGGADEKIHDPR